MSQQKICSRKCEWGKAELEIGIGNEIDIGIGQFMEDLFKLMINCISELMSGDLAGAPTLVWPKCNLLQTHACQLISEATRHLNVESVKKYSYLNVKRFK